MRRGKIAHQQSHQQHSTGSSQNLQPYMYILGRSCGLLVHSPGSSRFTFSWMRPARTVSQAKEGEMLSTEALPRNQQLLPKMYTVEDVLKDKT